jgi:glycosyltransferase involved in cell wall biosynthesis
MPVRMKILIVTELFPDTNVPEVTGGVESRVFYLVKYLRQRHDVTVMAGGTAGGSTWRPPSIASVPLRLRRMASVFWRALHTEFDLVESSILVMHPVAFVLGLLKRRPVVFYYPDVLIGQWRSGAFSRPVGMIGEVLERFVLKLPVDRYIATTEDTRNKLLANGVKPDRITLVRIGYDPEMTTMAKDAAAAAPRSGPSVTTASRLVGYKRVDLVVRAFALLAERHADLRLRIMGQGPEREALEHLARELGVSSRIDFLGFVPSHEDVLREIASSSVFVSASEIEGFGLTTVEAAALDVPFVITDMPVFREVTRDGMGGLLFRMGDATDLAEKIDQVLSDDVLRKRCREEVKPLLESYAWDTLADETANLYAAVIDKRAAGA